MPPIQLPVVRPRAFDFSIISQVARCPRKAFYQYWLNRSPTGKNYPINFGVAYHTYREMLEKMYLDNPEGNWDLYHKAAFQIATEGWVDPPLEHTKAFLTHTRLRETCIQSFAEWKDEKLQGHRRVLFAEQGFEIILPSGRKYGGRFDQLFEWVGKLWVRDYKTTSRMGKRYAEQFEPNNQLAGYIWSASELSIRPVEGVLVEVVYNTKLKGPEFHPFISTRNKGHLDQWIESTEEELNQIEKMEERDVWPMRTGACNDYGGCYFREACKHEHWKGIERWLEGNTQHSVWDFMDPDKEKGDVD